MQNGKIEKPDISCVIFDLGNVVLFFDHLRMASRLSGVTRKNPENDFRTIIEDESWQIFENGFMSPGVFYNKFLSLLNISPTDLSFDDFRIYFCDIFYPNKAMIPFIDNLKKNATRIILLSNTNKLHYDFIRKNFPIVERFDARVLSYKEGHRKPEKVIFKKAIRLAGCRPENILYIDDIAKFTQVAKVLGVNVLTYDPKHHERLNQYSYIPWSTTDDHTR